MTNSCKCFADSCVIGDKAKEREKRIVVCNSPGCQMQFHAACIGHSKMSERELKNMFFVCLKCKAYLEYSAQIAKESFLSELDSRLDSLKNSILRMVDDKIEEKFKEFSSKVQEVNEACSEETNALKSEVNLLRKQVCSQDAAKRKKNLLIRNFPEKTCIINGKTISNCSEAAHLIAETLDLEDEAESFKDIRRLGKPRDDGKPRLIMVKSTERTVRLFLSKARQLKQKASPLCKVFLHEDLPVEVNKRLAEFRKRARDHRTNFPDEDAYVRNKKLYINGSVVDDIKQDF